MQELEKLKYPIGKYTPPATINAQHIQLWIEDLANFPQEIASITSLLSEADLEVAYRPEGWTVRQVVHHLADSHINAYTRVHLTLTEDNPSIRPYFEDKWAELTDGKTSDINLSISILKAVHERLVFLLRKLKTIDFERTYFHPEAKKEFTLGYLVGNYAWHGKHHLAHIGSTLKG
ncbi:putative metal-dependent hydrolase [Pedobacter boryungensis]|uniref:Metal-dependent hydrolase n=2 Tax=Pedobacter boryungensis TaxID=869962 RepID=A0ABX2DBK1_9SPHI|nr:putative metal-dependent hydrolase [Pedobacter boryungensis]